MRTTTACSIGLAFILGGCASSSSSAPSTPSAATPQEPSRAAAAELVPADTAFAGLRVFSGDGSPADPRDIASAAEKADVVILAEQHGHPRGLSAAASIWRQLLTRGGQPALALEFFERDEQSRIDDYLAGLSTEDVFLRRTNRAPKPDTNPWEGSYPPGHRDMVEAAKTSHAPVIAANAPRAYVRLARTGGYAALAKLTPEQKRLFVLPRFAADGTAPNNRYWHDFLSFMGTTPEQYAASSATEREKTDGMFRSQSMWDATMADSVRQALASGNRPVVLVVGQFHADYAKLGGGGTVQALKAVRPETKVVVISFQDADTWRDDDKDRADFVVYCGERPQTAAPQPAAKH